jgi:hypothetical protein
MNFAFSGVPLAETVESITQCDMKDILRSIAWAHTPLQTMCDNGDWEVISMSLKLRHRLEYVDFGEMNPGDVIEMTSIERCKVLCPVFVYCELISAHPYQQRL